MKNHIRISKLPNIAQTMVKESIERSSYYIDDGYRDVDQVMLSLSDPELQEVSYQHL